MHFSLDGQWKMSSPDFQGGEAIPAELPGDNYSALLAAAEIPDPYYGMNENLIQDFRRMSWVFEREFDCPDELLKCRKVFLNLEMLDTFATVFINGKPAIRTGNMFRRYRPEVKKYLKPGKNIIRIVIAPPKKEAEKRKKNSALPIPQTGICQVKGLNFIRKTHCHGGWDWGITLCVCGCYHSIYLMGVENCRVDYLYDEQKFMPDKSCQVKLHAVIFAAEAGTTEAEFCFNGESRKVRGKVLPGENIISAVFQVDKPELWWPNGYGKQHLYEVSVTVEKDILRKKIGLRHLELINAPDRYGVSMTFRVNGRDVFCKGADWIPCDALYSRQTPEKMDQLLSDAADANMNMLRVWGGGQYEHEFFYELCDEKGLLIWHDFMFACSLYPSDKAFLDEVEHELRHQIRRLRSHPSIALWCGDNEVIGAIGWYEESRRRRDEYVVNYDRLNRKLAEVAGECDDSRVFWPSSPCGGPGNFNDGWHDDSCGDMHYWEVWHGGKEFESYYRVRPRFCSEFGFQSFPSEETVRSFCPESEMNVFSPVMELHQKNDRGNLLIVGMFGRYFRMPDTFANFLYLSQVQQALAVKTGVEFFRSLKPRCMGTLYWQLNDNNPVASWSSIEYCGKWKILHYMARKFYAPFLVCARPEENGDFSVYCISDLPDAGIAEVDCLIYRVSGELVSRHKVKAAVAPDGVKKLPLVLKKKEFRDIPGGGFAILRGRLTAGKKEYASENTVYSDVFKHLELPEVKLTNKVENAPGGKYITRLSGSAPAFFVTLDTPGIPGVFSDNGFTLLPEEEKIVTFTPRNPNETNLTKVKKSLKIKHLRESY